MNILLNNKATIAFLLMFGMIVSSCKGKYDTLWSMLESPLQSTNMQLLLPVTLCASDSALKSVVIFYSSIITELQENSDSVSANKILFNAVINKEPLLVSSDFYEYADDCKIRMDLDMYNTFKTGGLKALSDKYFTKDDTGGYYVVRKNYIKNDCISKVKNVNIEYMTYLLFNQGIYLYWWYHCEDPLIDLVVYDNNGSIPNK